MPLATSIAIEHQKVPTTRNANTAIDLLDSLATDIGGEFYAKAQAALKRTEKQIRSPFYTRIDTEEITGKFELIQIRSSSLKVFYLLAKAGNLTIKFYLKEIRNLRILNAYFDRDAKILEAMEKALDIWFDPDAEPFEVVLLLDPSVVVYFEKKTDQRSISQEKP